MDAGVVMFAIIGVVNVYLLYIVARIERTLEKKVDAESLKENLLLKDKILDANLANIHQKVNSLNEDVESFSGTIQDLQEVVRTFSNEVLQVKKRLEDFTSQMRATLDNALIKAYQHGRRE